MKIAEQIKLYTTLWQETNALYEKWAKKHGLSYYELLVILSLADKSACKQKDICQVLAASQTDRSYYFKSVCATRMG